jgi:protein SCO1
VHFVRESARVLRVQPSVQPVPGRRLLVGLLVILLVAVIPSVVVPTLMCRKEARDIPLIGQVTPFELVDERGQVFTHEAFRGHVTVVSFVFTRCDTVCPVIAMKLQRIQDKTFDHGGRIKLLSFTVDPKHDTPERLAAFAERYQAKPDRWRFVTGAPDKVHAVVEGPFMSSMMRLPDRPTGAPDVAHAGYFLLVDANLGIRGPYDSNRIDELDQMLADARHLARITAR